MKHVASPYRKLLFPLCLFFLFSCSKNVSMDWSQVATFSTPHMLEASSSVFKFWNFDGGTQILAISANIPWEITDLPDWLTADRLSGTGEDSISLICMANPSPTDERTAEFAIRAMVDDWDYSIPVTVYQVRCLGFVAPDTTDVVFKYQEGTQTIPVTSNVDWTVSVEGVKKGEPTDWLSARRSDDGNAVEISVVPIQDFRRQAYVVLTTKDMETRITVTQKSLLDVSPMNVDFSFRGGGIVISVDTESPFEITGGASWLTVESVSEKGFTLKASPNLSVARMAFVKVVMTGQLTPFVSRELTVRQADPYNGHPFVDLDLPSGMLWATCNVGASSPEEYGHYFAWGETSKKTIYSWDEYDFFVGGDTIGNKDHYIKFYKYNFSDSHVLDMDDDAAQANWGGIWRMPTNEELDELRFNCTWAWTRQGGHYGYKVTSMTNANSIFLPAAGYRYIKSLLNADIEGDYWTSTQITSYQYEAFTLHFDKTRSSYLPYTSTSRHLGLSVRPVCPGRFSTTAPSSTP